MTFQVNCLVCELRGTFKSAESLSKKKERSRILFQEYLESLEYETDFLDYAIKGVAQVVFCQGCTKRFCMLLEGMMEAEKIEREAQAVANASVGGKVDGEGLLVKLKVLKGKRDWVLENLEEMKRRLKKNPRVAPPTFRNQVNFKRILQYCTEEGSNELQDKISGLVRKVLTLTLDVKFTMSLMLPQSGTGDLQLSKQPATCGLDIYQLLSKTEWEKFFKEDVKSPGKKLAVLKSHQGLEDEFKHRKLEWLFLTVIPIVFTNFDCWTSKETQREIREIFLSCRLVSLSSCKELDDFVDLYWATHSYPPNFLGGCLSLSEGHHGDNGFQIDIIDKMKFHRIDRSPVISRWVSVALPFEKNRPHVGGILQNRVILKEGQEMQMLRKFGKHFRGLQILIYDENLWRTYQSLKNIFSLVPNLRLLQICWDSQLQHIDSCFPTQNNALPDLPYLTNMYIMAPRCGSDIFTLLKIDQYFPTLKQLSLNNFASWRDDFNYKQGIFPKLEILEFEMCTAITNIETKLLALSMFNNLNAPSLKHLEFGAQYPPGDPTTFWNRNKVEEIKKINKAGLIWLNKRYPDSSWEVLDQKWPLKFTRKLRKDKII